MREYKGRIPEAWSLLGTWSKLELPCRAPPLHNLQLCALVGLAVHRKDLGMAAGLMVAFQALFRTGELLGLRKSDVQFHGCGEAATLHLGLTKSGQRKGRPERLLVNDKYTLDLLALALESLKAGDLLIMRPPSQFRALRRLLSADAGRHRP